MNFQILEVEPVSKLAWRGYVESNPDCPVSAATTFLSANHSTGSEQLAYAALADILITRSRPSQDQLNETDTQMAADGARNRAAKLTRLHSLLTRSIRVTNRRQCVPRSQAQLRCGEVAESTPTAQWDDRRFINAPSFEDVEGEAHSTGTEENDFIAHNSSSNNRAGRRSGPIDGTLLAASLRPVC